MSNISTEVYLNMAFTSSDLNDAFNSGHTGQFTDDQIAFLFPLYKAIVHLNRAVSSILAAVDDSSNTASTSQHCSEDDPFC